MTARRIRTRDLVDHLVSNGQVNADIQSRLEKTRVHIDDVLIGALRHHGDALTREVCATILGQRRSRSAVPDLLRALSDESDHVRRDALWAIEKAAGLNVGDLSSALLLNPDDWPEVRRRLQGWWRIVKDDSYFR